MPTQRSNINPSYGEFYKEHRYLNCAKSAQRIVGNDSGTNPNWIANIDVNQYPTETTNGITFAVYVPGNVTCVAKWQGSGSFSAVSFGARTNSNRTTSSYRGGGSVTWNGGGADGSVVTNGRCTFTPGTAQESSVSVKGTTIFDFIICRLDEEDLWDGGEIFRPDYLALIEQYNPLSIRFMNPQNINSSMLSAWSDRMPIDAITYHGTQWWPDHKVGLITGTNTYTASSYTGMPGSYTNGEFIHGNFQNDNTSTTVTINVGSRGAKPVLNFYQALPVTTGTNRDTRILASATYTLMYDSILDSWLFQSFGLVVGQPIEMLVELCNQTNMPGWFCIPFNASDDFITQFATYISNNYNPSTVYFEYVNEIWNFAFGFPYTTRAVSYGNSIFSGIGSGNGANYSGWYGYRMRQMSSLIKAVLPNAQIILASQGAAGDSAASLTAQIENVRFQNSSYSELTSSNAPILHADLIAYALYYGGRNIKYTDAQWTTSPELADVKSAVDDFNSGIPASIQSSFNWAASDMLATASQYANVNGTTGRWNNWNTLAASYSKSVVIYEQNHEIDAPTTTWASTTSPFSDSAYGGQAGLINLFLLGFLASDQYKSTVRTMLQSFYARSKSLSSSLFAISGANPWLTFAKLNPTTDTIGGDTTQPYYMNWLANVEINNIGTFSRPDGDA